ncbi:MAG: M1 family metallopeptidase [Bacteroidota bacterium]
MAALAAAPPAFAIQPPGLHYTIDAALDPARHRLTGHATIVYRSGADTALTALYLHTYPNAFSSPNTIYGREAAEQGENWELRDAKPRQYGWMTLDSATVDGMPATVRVDETIATLQLPRPLQPGDSLRFALRFMVQIPKHFDRIGVTGNAYSLSQWYPKMVVYDDEGWHPDPFHFMSEFYGDYGTFDVTLHVPDDFWVGATGLLTRASGGDNDIPIQDRDAPRDSVRVTLHAVTGDSLAGKWPHRALWAETDLARGDAEGKRIKVPRDGPVSLRVPRGAPIHYSYDWEDREADRDEADARGRARPLRRILAVRDTTITDTLRALAAERAEGDTLLPSMKTLHYHAERVHDFAWVASPDYVRGDTTWSGIAIRSLSFRRDQKEWADSKRFVVDAMRHHTERVGPYIYPQFTTTEAWCGGGAMEYPMLIMNEPVIGGGLFEDLDDTIAHELGHNWFYGMLGSDERAHPWLDEGFTQFIEDDYTDTKYPRGTFRWRYRFPWLTPWRAFPKDELWYLSRAWARDETPMVTSADQFHGYRDYATASYSKTAMMLHALRGVIGREAFDRFLHRYYEENLLRHPRPADVVRAAEEAAGRDLHDFFRDWTETTETASFALAGASSHRSGDEWVSRVSVRRESAMALPVTVEARFADGTSQRTRVATLERTSSAGFRSHARLVGAVLDPDHEVAEMDRLDNRSGIPPMRWRPIYDFPQTDAITVLYGPTVWHGDEEGMRLGGWFDGRYLPMRDFPRGILGFEGGWNVGTRNGDTAWRLGSWRHAGALGARGEIRFLGVRDEGLSRFGLTIRNMATARGFRHPFQTWWAGAEARDRYDLHPVDARYWSPGTTFNLSAGYRIEMVGPRRQESVELVARRGFSAFGGGDPASDASYDRAHLTLTHHMGVGMGPGALGLTVRVFGGSAWRRVPLEERFDAAEESRLDALDRFYENDRGPLRETRHYLVEGGGGLRGYAGRAALGQRIGALNLDLRQPSTGLFAFGDAGRAEASGLGESPPRAPVGDLIGHVLADAGVGYAYGPLKATLPVWVGCPKPGEAPWKVRWLFSLDLAGIHPWW